MWKTGVEELQIMAEYEAALITERTSAGLAAARARGRTGGRKPKMTPDMIDKAQRMYDCEITRGFDVPTTIHDHQVTPARGSGQTTDEPNKDDGTSGFLKLHHGHPCWVKTSFQQTPWLRQSGGLARAERTHGLFHTPARSPSPPSTRSSAPAWSRSSRCAGHPKAPTCCSNCVPASSTTTSPTTSTAGTPDSIS